MTNDEQVDSSYNQLKNFADDVVTGNKNILQIMNDFGEIEFEQFFIKFKHMIKTQSMPTVVVKCISQFIQAYTTIYGVNEGQRTRLDSLLDIELLNEMIRCVSLFPNYSDGAELAFLNEKLNAMLDQNPNNDMLKASIELARRNSSFGSVIPTILDISKDPCIHKNVDKYPKLFTYLQTHFLIKFN